MDIPISKQKLKEKYLDDINEEEKPLKKNIANIQDNNCIKVFVRLRPIKLTDQNDQEEKSGLLFTYGVTNSGKTYTILGSKNQPGLLIQSISLLMKMKNEILQQIKTNQQEDLFLDVNGVYLNMHQILRHPIYSHIPLNDIKFYWESFEIYNEDIFDLMSDYKQEGRVKLQLKEKENKKVYIKDLTIHEFENIDQIQSFIDQAIKNRTIGETMLNSSSSRSHSGFKIVLKFSYKLLDNEQFCESSLCFVDLAGSERAKKTENTGQLLTESCSINKTLLVLGRCIQALRDHKNLNNTAIVPFRESKLTRLLYEYFTLENNLVMIANIHPGRNYFDETMKVLSYAAIAQETKPIKIIESNFENQFNQLSINPLKNNNFQQYQGDSQKNIQPVYQQYEQEQQQQILTNKILENLVKEANRQIELNRIYDKLNQINQNAKIRFEREKQLIEESSKEMFQRIQDCSKEEKFVKEILNISNDSKIQSKEKNDFSQIQNNKIQQDTPCFNQTQQPQFHSQVVINEFCQFFEQPKPKIPNSQLLVVEQKVIDQDKEKSNINYTEKNEVETQTSFCINQTSQQKQQLDVNKLNKVDEQTSTSFIQQSYEKQKIETNSSIKLFEAIEKLYKDSNIKPTNEFQSNQKEIQAQQSTLQNEDDMKQLQKKSITTTTSYIEQILKDCEQDQDFKNQQEIDKQQKHEEVDNKEINQKQQNETDQEIINQLNILKEDQPLQEITTNLNINLDKETQGLSLEQIEQLIQNQGQDDEQQNLKKKGQKNQKKKQNKKPKPKKNKKANKKGKNNKKNKEKEEEDSNLLNSEEQKKQEQQRLELYNLEHYSYKASNFKQLQQQDKENYYSPNISQIQQESNNKLLKSNQNTPNQNKKVIPNIKIHNCAKNQ